MGVASQKCVLLQRMNRVLLRADFFIELGYKDETIMIGAILIKL